MAGKRLPMTLEELQAALDRAGPTTCRLRPMVAAWTPRRPCSSGWPRSKRNATPTPAEPPPLDIARVIAVLDRHGVEYILVGGAAAQAHGAQRLTKDVDCLAQRGAENLERLAGALRELNARLRIAGLTDDEAAALPVQIDRETLGRMEISTWRTIAPSGSRQYGPRRPQECVLGDCQRFHRQPGERGRPQRRSWHPVDGSPACPNEELTEVVYRSTSLMRWNPVNERDQQRKIRHRLAVLRHAEEVTGNVSATGRSHGISRPTFYKWLHRFEELGEEGLRDGSSRPLNSAGATDIQIVGKIVYLRQHYHFGPRKISMCLARDHDIALPKETPHDFHPGRVPGAGPSVGGPAKIWALIIQSRAPSPVTARAVSSRCRRWATTRQKSRAGPRTTSSPSSGPHTHTSPDGPVSSTRTWPGGGSSRRLAYDQP